MCECNVYFLSLTQTHFAKLETGHPTVKLDASTYTCIVLILPPTNVCMHTHTHADTHMLTHILSDLFYTNKSASAPLKNA